MSPRPIVLAIAFSSAALLVPSGYSAPISTNSVRQGDELGAGWKFIKDDTGPAPATAKIPPLDVAVMPAASPTQGVVIHPSRLLSGDTGSWESVTIPHTWNAVDGQQGKKANPSLQFGYFRGIGWYARPLTIPAAWKGKRVFIRFDAASIVAKPYVNGHLLGEHRGAFTAFCYELTPYLNFGGKNELRVEVDNSFVDDVPPISGDFNMNGGIYRPVHLIVTDPVCITPLDFASSGVYLTQKTLSDSEATVEAKTLVSNGSTMPVTETVETVVKDATGKSVARVMSSITVPAGKTQDVTLPLKLANPHRWNGLKDPYLYSVTVRVSHGDEVLDQVTQPLGLRTVAITEDKGFLLNDKPYPLHGVNRHQERKDQAWALTPENHQEDLAIIMEMGTTAIRLAHYPQSEYFYDLSDTKGMLLWNEISLVDKITDSPAFKANAEVELREMIMQRYNHPSVAFWGIFNEIRGAGSGDVIPELLEHLKATAKSMDSSRPIVAASCKLKQKFNKIPEWTAFNNYPGWYEKGTPEDMATIIDDDSNEIGGRRVGISEYGAGGNPFQHQEGVPTKAANGGGFHPEEWQTHVHEVEWSIMKGNPKLWGTFIWSMFDFAVSSRNEGGHPALNDKGMVTQDRKLKKDVFYFYKANWTEAPMVYIASRRMTPRKMATTEVKVYSNCPEAELIVNGKSLGKATPDNVKVARWQNVQLEHGKNVIKVTGQANGKTVDDSCEWVLE